MPRHLKEILKLLIYYTDNALHMKIMVDHKCHSLFVMIIYSIKLNNHKGNHLVKRLLFHLAV